MLIDQEKCIGCGKCRPFCTAKAIVIHPKNKETGAKARAEIVRDECVECHVCLRSGICPTDALVGEELDYPRVIRRHFSDPIYTHPGTDIPGRGTEEMKTNDVTGRFKPGYIGVGLEFGRPGVGLRLKEVEKGFARLLPLGVELEPNNPLTLLIDDRKTGRLKEEVRNEKVLSAIIECACPVDKVQEVFAAVTEIAKEINTVFSLDVISKVEPDGSIPCIEEMEKAGLTRSANAKMNLGLGRPFVA